MVSDENGTAAGVRTQIFDQSLEYVGVDPQLFKRNVEGCEDAGAGEGALPMFINFPQQIQQQFPLESGSQRQAMVGVGAGGAHASLDAPQAVHGAGFGQSALGKLALVSRSTDWTEKIGLQTDDDVGSIPSHAEAIFGSQGFELAGDRLLGVEGAYGKMGDGRIGSDELIDQLARGR